MHKVLLAELQDRELLQQGTCPKPPEAHVALQLSKREILGTLHQEIDRADKIN